MLKELVLVIELFAFAMLLAATLQRVSTEMRTKSGVGIYAYSLLVPMFYNPEFLDFLDTYNAFLPRPLLDHEQIGPLVRTWRVRPMN